MKRLDLLSLYALFVILNVVDVFNTQALIWYQGYDIELGPLPHWLLLHTGSTLILWLPKLIILLFVGYLCKLLQGTPKETLWRNTLIVMCILMSFVDIYSTWLVCFTL